MRNDAAYNNVDHIPDGSSYPDRWEEEARTFREAEAAIGRARLNTAYGDHDRERFDLFHPAGRPEGLLIFVHGGYWLRFHRTTWSHFAQGATARGWAVAMPSYPLAPEVRIADITRSISTAIRTIAGYVAGPIALAGHSAGGHLVSRMAMADASLPPEVTGRIRTVMPISPVSDLRPLIETSMNADFRLDAAAAAAESPALGTPALDVPVHVWVGAEERPVFLDQARWLSEAWPGSTLTIAEGRHHFDVIDELRTPDSAMLERLLG
ncbi:alpha/beta hydrolase [Ovoidimarina sediminis]|uniref:alpha/beta hydrolase n=1 Tax=Ovoidimarina sediminis TaxID=3079856 RepID=UPI00290A15DC|nr:alpha/beta hydrolase [Rhodophyticola sp. MJ-SS7]MDU8943675.1 alpha/beta hydrolase [Rhodophyticola sp. MJ-SS7]